MLGLEMYSFNMFKKNMSYNLKLETLKNIGFWPGRVVV